MEFSVTFLSHIQANLYWCLFYQGAAYIGGICKNYAFSKLNYSVQTHGYHNANTGFVTFAGNSLDSNARLTFAHEVGHSLGAQHDGWMNTCNRSKFLMAQHTATLPVDDRQIISECSKNYFRSEIQKMLEVLSW